MTNPMNKLRSAFARRAEYSRLVNEIRGMSNETALDLGIFRSDAHRIAREAVYGDH
ncbi:protein of unknown function [Poseidonocella pacifica]|uniref:YjiS-like domain-containing protein n=1 Tax=Poseidonocella pacifica TaxID=871651 RepID=A0A1I0VKQ1_9RHOB|nr:DUF1127 domain-containing protein [Poseidonocella pacifica]SFA76470.1 protein of unknown function [Poseidonocella pacifica]